MDQLAQLAREIMSDIDNSLTENFVNIVLFARDNPSLRVLQRKSKKNPNPEFGTKKHLVYLANRYANGREVKPLPRPQTVPDPALSTVLKFGYEKKDADLNALIEGHRIAMVAENVVGELLERYIDEKLSDEDWIWCAGEVVRSVDFIRRSKAPDTVWESLQIKNRDNSENSSSSAVRKGTQIEKWHRTISRTGATRWHLFPVGNNENKLDENDFRAFIKAYLQAIPQ